MTLPLNTRDIHQTVPKRMAVVAEASTSYTMNQWEFFPKPFRPKSTLLNDVLKEIWTAIITEWPKHCDHIR